MQTDQKAAGRYYGRFHVMDTVKFFNGKLILAKGPDGGQVFLQEIEMNHFVPPGIREVLRNFDHPHVAPIHDVLEKDNRIVLIHPLLLGEPLSMLVDPEHPMPPKQALHVFRRLLRTMVDLYNLPLPMTTTLDPRNVIMYENNPYVLFINFKRLSRPRFHEKWRELLYFLLTGEEAEGDIRYKIKDQNLNIPPELKKLVTFSLDPKNSIHDVLSLAEDTHFEIPEKKNSLKKWLYPVSAAVLVIFGVVLGIQLTSSPVVSEPHRLDGEPLQLSTVAQLRLEDPPQVYSLGLPVGEPVRIRAELTRERNRSFTLALVSNEPRREYGIYIDEQGKIFLLERRDGEEPILNGQDPTTLPVEPGKQYVLEIVYKPGEPIYVTVMDSSGQNIRRVVGSVPAEIPSSVLFQGGEGTVLHQLRAIRLDDLNEMINQGESNSPSENTVF